MIKAFVAVVIMPVTGGYWLYDGDAVHVISKMLLVTGTGSTVMLTRQLPWEQTFKGHSTDLSGAVFLCVCMLLSPA